MRFRIGGYRIFDDGVTELRTFTFREKDVETAYKRAAEMLSRPDVELISINTGTYSVKAKAVEELAAGFERLISRIMMPPPPARPHLVVTEAEAA